MGDTGRTRNNTVTSATLDNGAPALNSELVRKANAAGMAVDYGDATSREYARNTDEIMSMQMSDTEKQSALKELHALTEKQLQAEAGATNAYSMGMGPARFDAQKVARNADTAVQARANTNAYMQNLRDTQRKAQQTRLNAGRADAMRQAISDGKLEFTYNGQTFRRSSRRSKSFTLVRE